MTSPPIEGLLDRIEAQRSVVDARLTSPARWRGPLRRPSDRRRARRVAGAFDRLVVGARREGLGPLGVDRLLDLHRRVTGDGEFRTRGARIGDHVVRFPSRLIPGLVEEILERAGDGLEPAPLAAARVHLELLLVHPFGDGNGRTARLAAAWVLLRAGYRSTLLTAVEQHSRHERAQYGHAFKLITVGGLDTHRPWLQMALVHMAEASRHATAFRRREEAMRAALAESGVVGADQEQLLIAHDFEGASIHPLAGFDRWGEISRSLAPAASFQIRRLLAEEAVDSR